MKLLSVMDLYFKLPDDFQGTKAEAMRLLADYIEKAPDLPDLLYPIRRRILSHRHPSRQDTTRGKASSEKAGIVSGLGNQSL